MNSTTADLFFFEYFIVLLHCASSFLPAAPEYLDCILTVLLEQIRVLLIDHKVDTSCQVGYYQSPGRRQISFSTL